MYMFRIFCKSYKFANITYILQIYKVYKHVIAICKFDVGFINAVTRYVNLFIDL